MTRGRSLVCPEIVWLRVLPAGNGSALVSDTDIASVQKRCENDRGSIDP